MNVQIVGAFVLAMAALGVQDRPRAWVHLDGSRVEMSRTGSCWEVRPGDVICSDLIFVPTQVQHPRIAVKAGETVHVEFEEKPNRAHVSIWGEGGTDPVEIKNLEFPVSETPGTYVYKLCGTWDQGGTCFAFLAVVERVDRDGRPTAFNTINKSPVKEHDDPARNQRI